MSSYKLDNEVEQSILSILLVDVERLNTCYLESRHFNNELNARIYQAIDQLYKETHECNITELFVKNNDIAANSEYVLGLAGMYVTASDFDRLQQLQVDSYKKSSIIEIAKKLHTGKINYETAMSEISVIDSQNSERGTSTRLSSQEIYDLITTSNAKLNFNHLKKIESSIGFLKNTVNIIAARTSVGKSAFALNMLNDLSVNQRCIYLNMEMTSKEIYQRLVGINVEIPINRFIDKNLTQEEQNKIITATNIVAKKNYAIYDGSKSIRAIKSIIKRETKESHCVVFVDYIGYVHTNKKQNDRERIGEATRELQQLSKDFNVTVFVLAQINREGTDAPTLTNLKDSGELEQTAHAVLILHDPQNDLTNQRPRYEIIVAKNRSGRLGKIEVIFNKATQQFFEVS